MRLALIAGLFGALASGVTVAAPPEENPGKRRGGPTREKRDFFAQMLRLDQDRNGKISFAEFSKSDRVTRLTKDQRRQLFDRLDKNKDGEISRNEVPHSGSAAPRPRGGMRRERVDTNRDGKVSLDEFRKSPRMADVPAGRQEEIFRKMDRNGDGFLTREDFKGRHHPEHPGGGERAQRGPIGGSQGFQDLDTDRSGSLSLKEFRKGPRVEQMDQDRQENLFKKMDLNGDGSLGKDELMPPGRGPGMGPGSRPGGGRGEGKGPRPKPKKRDQPE